MCDKEYTIYVDEGDKVVKIISSLTCYARERIACRDAMVSVGDRIELIRVRD